jgi:hypothetical protein
MWVAFTGAHITLSFTTWTLFLIGLYETDRKSWTLLFGQPRWWGAALLILPSPILYALGFRLRSKARRPRLSGGRRWWRGLMLTLWVFFSIGVGEELFLPQGHVRLAITYGGLAALAWWGASRIERSYRGSPIAGESTEAAPA